MFASGLVTSVLQILKKLYCDLSIYRFCLVQFRGSGALSTHPLHAGNEQEAL